MSLINYCRKGWSVETNGNGRAYFKAVADAELFLKSDKMKTALEKVLLYSRPKTSQVNLNLALDEARKLLK